MRQTVFLASFLLAIYLVLGQQQYYPVYFNQSRPVNSGWPPKYNYSNNYGNKYNYSNNYGTKYNYSNNYGTKYNYSNNYGTKYNYSNQFPNYYPSKFNFTRYAPYNATANGTRDGHLFLGQIQMYDRLLFSQVYRKESRWWSYRDTLVEYPSAKASGYVVSNARIYAIRVYNQFLDGNTARASIRKGGIGYTYCQIYLESTWNHGFQYLVQFYGH